MNWDRVEGNWMQFKGKVQQKWGKLTNDDLDLVKGKRNELLQGAYSSAMATPRTRRRKKSIHG
jgi:uncharacterized protein YjbJ (UPF0337 family)